MVCRPWANDPQIQSPRADEEEPGEEKKLITLRVQVHCQTAIMENPKAQERKIIKHVVQEIRAKGKLGKTR